MPRTPIVDEEANGMIVSIMHACGSELRGRED